MEKDDREQRVAAAMQKLEIYRKYKHNNLNSNDAQLMYPTNNFASSNGNLIYSNSDITETNQINYSQQNEVTFLEPINNLDEIQGLKDTIATLIAERDGLNVQLLSAENALIDEKVNCSDILKKIEELNFDNTRLIEEVNNCQLQVQGQNDALHELKMKKDEFMNKFQNIEYNYNEALQRLEEVESKLISLADEKELYHSEFKRLKKILHDQMHQKYHKHAMPHKNLHAKLEKSPKMVHPDEQTTHDLHEELSELKVETPPNMPQLEPENPGLCHGLTELGKRETVESQRIMSRRQHLALLRERADGQGQQPCLDQTLNDVMEENVLLKKRIESLEHLIILLEGESECIGEYIGIYHAQRDYLHKRSEARDNYLIHLLKQQAELRESLTLLRNLVLALSQDESIASVESLVSLKPLIGQILKTLNSILEPLLSTECAFKSSYAETLHHQIGGHANDFSYIPTNSRDDCVAACKCCQGTTKIL